MSDLDINESVLAQLRSAADIVEVIGDHTRLKKAGRSWKGLCPFHNERTPSFTVDRDKGLYHCFGCGVGGDVIHFVRQIDRLDFPEAVEALASRFGVSIPRRERRGPREDRRDRLLTAVSAAQRFYAERLARPGNAAAAYLVKRGVPEELWKAHGLGHAPEGWDALSKALSGAFPEDVLVEAGLLQPRPEGRGAYDRFRDRLLFVLRDERGRPVGFGGRALSPEGEPKYLNSPETPIFSKKRLLYGLSEARDAIRKRDRAVLVEGYFGHLALIRAGVGETVASMGTALTPEQTERLRRLTGHAIVCYDGDPAGRAATRGALVHLLSHGFEARVARLPASEDPDDLLRREGPEAVAARIEEAPDALTWLLEDLEPQASGIPPAEKRERVGKILEILGAIPDRILRYEEVRRLARVIGVPIEVLWNPRPEKPREPKERSSDTGTAGNSRLLSIAPAERGILKGLLHGGELKSLVLSGLSEEWLSNEGVRRLVRALSAVPNGTETIDFQGQIADLTEEDRNLISAIALEDSFEPTEKGVEEHLRKLETDFKREKGQQIQAEIRRAETEGRPTTEVDSLIRTHSELQKEIARLTRSRKG